MLTDRQLQSMEPPETGRLVIYDEAVPGLEFRMTPTGAKSWRMKYQVKGAALRQISLGPYPAIKLSDARDIYTAAKKGMRMFSAHVEPAIGAKALDDVRRADIVELLDDLQNKKGLNAQVNRIRSQLIAAFNRAVEREFLDVNPAATVKRRKNIEAPRERVLEDKELAAIWKAAASLSYPSNQLVRLLILTGQRRDEVRCLPWSEIGNDLWTLPAERNKGKRQHEVPLTKAALEVLGGKTRPGPFVFSCDAEGKKPYAGMKRLKEILDRESGVTGWTIHDIRRTVATGLGRLGVAQEVIEHILNHSRPTLHKTYNVHAYRDEKRTALEAWARYVEGVVTGSRANVVELAERRQAT